MSDEDPFAPQLSNPDKTVIRPNPGGRARLSAPIAPIPGAEARRPEPAIDLGRTTGGSLAALAAPILSLVGQLRTQPYRGEPAALQQRLLRQLRDFQDAVARGGAGAELARAATYVLSATVDDVVLSSPWGRASGWATYGLVLQLFNETNAGKRFYDLLEQRQREPGANIGLLELMYFCLAFGFEGEMRVHPRGANELSRIRESLYRAIRAVRGEFERELSPRWRGVVTERKLMQAIPAWVSLACAVALSGAMYTAFGLALGRASDQTFRDIAELPPRTKPPVVAVAPLPSGGPGLRDRMAARLQAEESAGQLKIEGDALFASVRIVGGLFASGSTAIDPAYVALLQRIARAIESEPGRVAVLGHTDDQPPRTRARFPSNYELSLARAQSVAREIAPVIIKEPQTGRERDIATDGRGDAEPLESNATPEGRAANRRIEITLQQTGR